MGNDASGQLRALGGVLVRTAGLAALRRGLPLYCAVFMTAVVVFVGRYAMKASEIVGVAVHSLGSRGALLLAWL